MLLIPCITVLVTLIEFATAATSEITIDDDLLFNSLKSGAYGYSIEAESILNVTKTELARGLFASIRRIAGSSPPLRMGGITNDYVIVDPDQDEVHKTVGSHISVREKWFHTWGDYWLNDTKIIYTTNFQDDNNEWGNGTQLAEWAVGSLGDRLEALELGNEPDHYEWGDNPTNEYVARFFKFYDKLQNQTWWRGTSIHAAVFADPPGFPSIAFYPGMTIENAIDNGLKDPSFSAYVTHNYPLTVCFQDHPEAKAYLTVETLSNHDVVWSNISQFIPTASLALSQNAPLIIGETNTAACRGRSGISDTMAAALWGVDYALTAAAFGIPQVYWHLHAKSDYSAFIPLDYDIDGHHIQHGVRANFYGHFFLAHVISGSNQYKIAALPNANDTDFSGFGVFNSNSSESLRKLVFVDLGIWNTSEPYTSSLVANPEYNNSRYVSNGSRPVRDIFVTTPWQQNTSVEVIRLMAEGTNAKSGVNVSGTTLDNDDGSIQGDFSPEILQVGHNGTIKIELPQAEAVLVQLGNKEANDSSSMNPSNTSQGNGKNAAYAIGWHFSTKSLFMSILLLLSYFI